MSEELDGAEYKVVDPKDIHVHVCACGQIATTRFMLGKDWYERFEREFAELRRVYKYTDDVDWETILKAAKRAAGLGEEEKDGNEAKIANCLWLTERES